MTGTQALTEINEFLNDMYNNYISEDDYDLAEMVDGIRSKVDELYNEYAKRGD